MNDTSLLRSLLEYDFWANLEVLKNREMLQKAKKLTDQFDTVYSGMLQVRQHRLAQLENKSTSFKLEFSFNSPQFFEDLTQELYERYSQVISENSVHLQREISYASPTGEILSQSVTDILVHVFYQAMHHRGQIALLTRHAGGIPKQIDYLLFARARHTQFI
jgi:uncharacterized damage-inducible protein DinB